MPDVWRLPVYVSMWRFRGSEPSGRTVQIVASLIGLSYAHAPANARREPLGAHDGMRASTRGGEMTTDRVGSTALAMASRSSDVMYARLSPSGDHAGFEPGPTSRSPVPSA